MSTPNLSPQISPQISPQGYDDIKDLRSIAVNYTLTNAAESLSVAEYEELRALKQDNITVFLTEPANIYHYSVSSHPSSQHLSAIFLERAHIARITLLLGLYEEQFATGGTFVKNPYREGFDLWGLQKHNQPGPEAPSLVSRLNIITSLSNLSESKLGRGSGRQPPASIDLASRSRPSEPSRNSPKHEVLLTNSESEQENSDDTDSDTIDVFRILDSKIIELLAPEVGIAADVIANLYKLPADLRSLVYGFTSYGSNDEKSPESRPSYNKSGQNSGKTSSGATSSNKRQRFKSGGNGGDDDDDEDLRERNSRDSRNRDRTKAIVLKLKFACPFNIMDPARYCVRNEIGGTGELYRSCMGTGWTDIRFLLDHLRDHHRPAQCARCWEILDNSGDLNFHRDRLEPRCQDLSSIVEFREGIDNDTWGIVEIALKTPRLKKGDKFSRKSDFEKWMDAWDILFPARLYPDLPKPSHPYYSDPMSVCNNSPSGHETRKRMAFFKALWDAKAKTAKSTSDDHSQEYRVTWEEACQMIRKADELVFRSSQQGSQLLPSSWISTGDESISGSGPSNLSTHTQRLSAGQQDASRSIPVASKIRPQDQLSLVQSPTNSPLQYADLARLLELAEQKTPLSNNTDHCEIFNSAQSTSHNASTHWDLQGSQLTPSLILGTNTYNEPPMRIRGSRIQGTAISAMSSEREGVSSQSKPVEKILDADDQTSTAAASPATKSIPVAYGSLSDDSFYTDEQFENLVRGK